MIDPAVPLRFAVWTVGEGSPQAAGSIEIDVDGHVTVLDAVTGSDLVDAAAALNGEAALSLQEPPAPDDPPRTMRRRPVDRGEPDFVAAVCDTLYRSFGLRVEAEGTPETVASGHLTR